MLGPVFLVFFADALGVEGEAGLPFAEAVFVRDVGEIGHPRAVELRLFHLDDGREDGESARLLHQLAPLAHDVVAQGDFVAGLGFEVIGQPAGNLDFIIGKLRLHKAGSGGVDGGDHRIRSGAKVVRDFSRRTFPIGGRGAFFDGGDEVGEGVEAGGRWGDGECERP